MDFVIKCIGIVICILAIVCLLKPDIAKSLLVFIKKGSRVYFAGLLRSAVAVVFFLGAEQCRHFWIIFAFGVAFLLSAILIFVLGPQKMRPLFDWMVGQSNLVFRLFAIIVIALGLIILLSA
jgi:hypothetical protein